MRKISERGMGQAVGAGIVAASSQAQGAPAADTPASVSPADVAASFVASGQPTEPDKHSPIQGTPQTCSTYGVLPGEEQAHPSINEIAVSDISQLLLVEDDVSGTGAIDFVATAPEGAPASGTPLDVFSSSPSAAAPKPPSEPQRDEGGGGLAFLAAAAEGAPHSSAAQ